MPLHLRGILKFVNKHVVERGAGALEHKGGIALAHQVEEETRCLGQQDAARFGIDNVNALGDVLQEAERIEAAQDEATRIGHAHGVDTQLLHSDKALAYIFTARPYVVPIFAVALLQPKDAVFVLVQRRTNHQLPNGIGGRLVFPLLQLVNVATQLTFETAKIIVASVLFDNLYEMAGGLFQLACDIGKGSQQQTANLVGTFAVQYFAQFFFVFLELLVA